MIRLGFVTATAIIVATLSAVALTAAGPSTRPVSAMTGLSVRIAVQGPNWLPSDHSPPPLQVVFENTSAGALSVTNENSSFGYSNLTFDYMLPGGGHGTLSRIPRPWRMNALTSTTLGPGQCLVRDIYFDPNVWSGLPELSQSTDITFTATYTDDNVSAPVWHGNRKVSAHSSHGLSGAVARAISGLTRFGERPNVAARKPPVHESRRRSRVISQEY
jgi:hypothetical protein